jgi:uncharacterized protein
MTAGPVDQAQPRERRVERSRRSIELLLDTVFRPRGWAAALAYRTGLQGHFETSTLVVDAGRRARHPGAQPLRIAFASDFHAGATTHPALLSTACGALASLEPDVLLLGGDFVSVRAAYIDRLAPRFAEIPAPFGKFAVMGNHDLRANRAQVVRALERAGIQLLTNAHQTLRPPFHDVTICGLDDPTRGNPRADLALDGAPGTRIVLMHSPDGILSIGDRAFDLALCGHTHGGQIAAPWGQPLVVPSGRFSRQYCSGRFELEGTRPRMLLVSRGVGCSTIPVRLFAPPQVHLCLIT